MCVCEQTGNLSQLVNLMICCNFYLIQKGGTWVGSVREHRQHLYWLRLPHGCYAAGWEPNFDPSNHPQFDFPLTCFPAVAVLWHSKRMTKLLLKGKSIIRGKLEISAGYVLLIDTLAGSYEIKFNWYNQAMTSQTSQLDRGVAVCISQCDPKGFITPNQ